MISVSGVGVEADDGDETETASEDGDENDRRGRGAKSADSWTLEDAEEGCAFFASHQGLSPLHDGENGATAARSY